MVVGSPTRNVCTRHDPAKESPPKEKKGKNPGKRKAPQRISRETTTNGGKGIGAEECVWEGMIMS